MYAYDSFRFSKDEIQPQIYPKKVRAYIKDQIRKSSLPRRTVSHILYEKST